MARVTGPVDQSVGEQVHPGAAAPTVGATAAAPAAVAAAASAKGSIKGKDLSADDIVYLGYLKRVFPLLDKLHDVGCERDKAGNRLLHFDDYCKLVLLYTWNPVLASVRDVQAAVGLKNVAKALGVGRFSLGSFSEAPRAFEPELLQGVIAELAGALRGTDTKDAKDPRGPLRALRPLPQDPRLKDLEDALTLSDGTVLAALPRLARAASAGTCYCTTRDGKDRYGWRLHTQLDLKTFCPRRIQRTGASTAGEAGEAEVLQASLEAGRCYVNDGGFADSRLLDAIVDAGSNFVGRLPSNGVFEVIDERFLSQEALDAGVVRDALVQWRGRHPIRVVYVQIEPRPPRGGKDKPTDLLVIGTDLLGLPAELVALIYRQRYSVELFFRQLKHLLGLRHLLSQREEGIDIQAYCAVIVCLLINLITGKKPNKAMVSMVGWFLLGVATEQELIDYLNKPDNTGVKTRAKDELWKKLGY
jgi:hypothetical protein